MTIPSDTPTFLGVAYPSGIWHVEAPADLTRWVRHVAGAHGAHIEVVILPEHVNRTLRQNAGFHAMIAPWAKGEGHEIDDLKDDLLRHVFGTRESVNLLTGEVTQKLAEPHTSTLSKAKMSTLIDETLRLAAEAGYVLLAPAEYRARRAAGLPLLEESNDRR